MNNISGQYYFEFADEKDSSEILEILEEDNFQGKISLLYTRRPNAYKSIKSEGEEVFIVVCRDREKEVIAGFGVLAINSCFVNGHKKKVGYLFGLRVRKEYQKKARIIHHGYENLGKIISEKGIEFCYTTILSENNNAERLLEKKRLKYMPLKTSFFLFGKILPILNTYFYIFSGCFIIC